MSKLIEGKIKTIMIGMLALCMLFMAVPVTQVSAAEQVYTEKKEPTGGIVKITDDGNELAHFTQSWLLAGGETAYCIDIDASFKAGYKTKCDATDRFTEAQITNLALNLEYVKNHADLSGLDADQRILLEQCTLWRRLSDILGWGYGQTHAVYTYIPKDLQDNVYKQAQIFAEENKDKYDCGGYIFVGEGQDIAQFWAKLANGKAEILKSSSNKGMTEGNNCYSLAGAVYTVYSDQACSNSVGKLTTKADGSTDSIELTVGTYYVKETQAPKGFKQDSSVYTVTVKKNETAVLKTTDMPKATSTLLELFKIDMETGEAMAQGGADLAGARFTWNYYDGYYTTENLPDKPTRTWITETKEVTDKDGIKHFITALEGAYKASGDDLFVLDGEYCLPLGTITVSEVDAPEGYLLEDAYLQAQGSSEKIYGTYIAQIREDGELAVLTGVNQYSVSDQVIRGGVMIQKRDLETSETAPQGNATLAGAEFTIISLNNNPVLVDGTEYGYGEAVKVIVTDKDGLAATEKDTLPYGVYRLEETKAPEGYLSEGAVPQTFEIIKDDVMVELTDPETSIYNQVKRGDIEGVKIGAGSHVRLANVPFQITSKTTRESHIVVTDINGQFSTAAEWTPHTQNTNAGTSSEDGVWFGTAEPNDEKGALLYDSYVIEELNCESNEGHKLIPPFEITVSRDKLVINLGTMTDDKEEEEEILIHTTATGEDGEKIIVAADKVTIIDTVTLEGLKVGTEYQLRGWEMVREEGTELVINGERIESEYSFTATASNMKVQMLFTFDASELSGKSLVTFEELYDLTIPEEPEKVAEHEDIDDEGQTVTITDHEITIHTTATDKETGGKVIDAAGNVTIVDTVTMEGLDVGTKYKLTGWQMLKDENAALIINGQRIENDYTFTATDPDMEVQIEFTFDASDLAGKSLVTFEELNDLTTPDEPEKVAEHKDIDDEGQTVKVKEREEKKEEEKSYTPTPTTGGKNTTSTTSYKTPKTGDMAPMLSLLAVCIISLIVMAIIVAKKLNKKVLEE